MSEIRQQLAEGHLTRERATVLLESLAEVIAVLSQELNQLSAKELLAFDRVLERKLYDLDRREVHASTDGSDDGFLYARGFIVAAGKGERSGRAKPKQYEALQGKSMLLRSAEAFGELSVRVVIGLVAAQFADQCPPLERPAAGLRLHRPGLPRRLRWDRPL